MYLLFYKHIMFELFNTLLEQSKIFVKLQEAKMQ